LANFAGSLLARIFLCISAQNQKLVFCLGEGLFQFSPQKISFYKNLLAKEVFRRPKRLLSNLSMVRFHCLLFAQNLTFSGKYLPKHLYYCHCEPAKGR